MNRLFPAILVAAAFLLPRVCGGDVPEKGGDWTKAILPVGKWKVEFTNGVTENCEISNFGGGRATVEEPRRKSGGTVVVKGNTAVITFDDDRVERWTPVGERFVVEHWFPGSRFLTATPVLGIAERAR